METYRGYTIEKDSYGYSFWFGDKNNYESYYDGDSWHSNARYASSLKGAKEEIDSIIFEKTSWEVCEKENSKPEKFIWLEDALKFAITCNAYSITPKVNGETLELVHP